MRAYSLNARVFWPLLSCGCAALLGLLRGPAWGADVAAALLLLLGAAAALRLRGWPQRRRAPAESPEAEARQRRRRACLERFYEQQLRLSPHVLGHGKAHVAQVAGAVARAGRAPGRLALRGDVVPVGSAYEQHKVRRPDAFDLLLPLRLPPGLQLRAEPRRPGEAASFACALRAPAGGRLGLSEALCVELPGRRGRHLSAALLLRWFQGHVQRCLPAVRARLQERCRLSLAAGPGRPPTLRLTPCADYVCCHLALAVRLVPAIPLGQALYLTPPPSAAPPGAFWALNVSRQEQRLLGWLKAQVPQDACHLKCLQLLKGLRDLGGRALEPALEAQWGGVLSSAVLKTALLRLLLRGPWRAWEDRFLLPRLEEAVLFLAEALRRRTLLHVLFGNPGLPEALGLPRVLKEAAPVNLLADFDGPTLDRVAVQLLHTWKQAPRIIRMYSGPGYRRASPV